MRKLIFVFVLAIAACDLNPKITNLPDTVGDFITARYPTMLADPSSQPEIYNSAASDYGVYTAPEMYGSGNLDEYTLYASTSDYTMPTQQVAAPIYGTQVAVPTTAPGVAVPDILTVGSPADYIRVADKRPGGAVSTTPVKSVAVNVPTTEIVVTSGDTLYSISRKYSMPVNDLAIMNNMSSPFTLSVGQKIKVPNQGQVAVAQKLPAVNQESTVISSDPTTPLPKIAARTSSKFTWPLRGSVLSSYGAKSNGLFNDGINIGAKTGTGVGAAENGVVAYAGNELKGMGNLIIIQHSDGWMTVYAHMDTMTVRRGAKVLVGNKIGTVGQTGKVDQPQLHFEIRKGTKAYNPTEYLKK